ncbi:MAG: YlbF family regulator, partial [Clostridiales Family XIII bacterium]|nr:YlbF family regulator [Clostridiales Family XIII bacterium]
MANIHDMARDLAAAIRNSEEYRMYIAAKEKASQNPDLADALNDFREKQFELQRKQLAGGELG